MIVAVNVIRKAEYFSLKYHKIKEQLDSHSEAIGVQARQRFNYGNKELEKIRQSLESLMKDSTLHPFNRTLKRIAIQLKSEIVTKLLPEFSTDNIDWTRGRFSGEVIHLVIKNGLVKEKTFLTRKGNLIIIKRSELGLFRSLFR